MKLGDKLRTLRELQGWTQPQAAENIGIEQSYLSKLENDRSVPSLEVFRRILTSYGTNVVEIMDDIDPGDFDHLTQITDVADFLDNRKRTRQARLRRRTSVQTVLVAVGAGFIYAGVADLFFPEAALSGTTWQNQAVTFLGIVALVYGFLGLLISAAKNERGGA